MKLSSCRKLLGGVILVMLILSPVSSKLETTDKKVEKVGRAKREQPQPASSHSATEDEDPNRPDPFPLSIEWANFVKRMDEISDHLRKQIEKLIHVFSDKNHDYATNKTGFLSGFLMGFSKDLKPLVDIFVPLQEQLDLNKAYTVVDPAIDLETVAKATALAKANPTKDVDTGRLKWVEVNAMAATLHHIFNRLVHQFEQYGLAEVEQALDIQYPSWTVKAAQNESGDTYHDMVAREMAEFIHTEIISLGDTNHLIRFLEKLLSKKLGLKGWDPSRTNLNKYCYGNNMFGLIHDKFDVLIDAAQYLVMADMKYAIVTITSQIHKAHQAETSGGEKVNLQRVFDEAMANMTICINRKIKFSTHLAEIPSEVVVVPGPTVFRCDPLPLPKVTEEAGPKVTAPNCPPGIYIQNFTAYDHGKPLTVPHDITEPLKGSDGRPIDCIALERVALTPNGTVVPCRILDKICLDANGTQVPDVTIEIVPILIDPDKVPIHRDALIETFPDPDKCQWGKSDCTKDPDHPGSPPQGPIGGIPGDPAAVTPVTPTLPPPEWNCTVGPNDKGIGYIDCRHPGVTDANTAQFTLAFPSYLESELVLSPNGKCVGTCREYKNPTPTCTNKTTHCDLYRKSHCEDKGTDCMRQSHCPNKAKRCIRTSREVTFCPSAPGTGRVYDWYTINGQPHQVTGLHDKGARDGTIDITKCSTDKIMKVHERWEMDSGVILNTPQYCELCMCICADPIVPEGHHFFDTAPILANVAEGFVVAGLRFERKNNTLLLNIQQGKILPDGKLDPTTLEWYDTTKHIPHLVPLGSAGFDKLNLDIIEPGKATDVLSGVQWKVEQSALALEAGFSTFLEGKLGPDPPTFRGAKFPPPKEMRARHDLGDSISPVKQSGPSQPYPITDNSKYIEFDASSLEKDGGQAVVPFFDLQAMTSPDGHPRPLRNVGILYKSKHGSGGFITTSAKF